jgi:hypothetical protein
VAACLIAAMKANTLYWPMDRLPLANGTLLGFGGLGAASATLPVELALDRPAGVSCCSRWRR